MAEDLVDGVKDFIGRGKEFHILKNLKDEMIVTTVKQYLHFEEYYAKKSQEEEYE